MLCVQQAALALPTRQEIPTPHHPILLGTEHQAHHPLQILILLTPLRLPPPLQVVPLILPPRHRKD